MKKYLIILLLPVVFSFSYSAEPVIEYWSPSQSVTEPCSLARVDGLQTETKCFTDEWVCGNAYHNSMAAKEDCLIMDNFMEEVNQCPDQPGGPCTEYCYTIKFYGPVEE